MSDWFTDDAFCDAFGDHPLGLTDRRALACTCKKQRDVQAHCFSTQRVLRVYPEDCTQANAEFVLRKVPSKNPDAALQVEDDVCLQPMNRLCRWYSYQTKPMDINRTKTLTGPFFLGRFCAHHSSGAMRFRMTYDDDDSDDDQDNVVTHPVTPIIMGLDEGEDVGPNWMSNCEWHKHVWAALAGVHYEGARRRIDRKTREYNGEVQFLNLRHLHLDDAGVDALRPKINDFAVKTLNLVDTITPLSWGFFGPLVRGHMFPWVDALHLDENEFFGKEGARMLSRAVKSGLLRRLQHLSLQECGLIDSDIRELSTCFEHWPCLRYLSIGKNIWGDEGLRHFMQHGAKLQALNQLRIFDLEPGFSWRVLNAFAVWIVDESGWTLIRTIRLCEDFTYDNGFALNPGTGDPNWRYANAAKAVESALKFCEARHRWDVERPNEDEV
jgi:hypothetical protein